MRRRLGIVVLAMLGLAAAPPPAVVPPGYGTISITPRTADGDYDPTLSDFTAALSDAFTDRGFTILNDRGHAAYDAELVLSREKVGTALTKVRGQSSPMLAGGVVVPFSTGNSNIVALRRVRLEVRIRRRGEPGTIWHAAAVTVREGPARGMAADLARALLQSYPAQPADVIGVP